MTPMRDDRVRLFLQREFAHDDRNFKCPGHLMESDDRAGAGAL